MEEPSSTTNSRVNQEQGSVSYSDEYYVRSYTCTFCKKGFSNAQALGGHMNIHRRDRAKLRESSSSNEEDLDSMIVDDTDHYSSSGVTPSNDRASGQSEVSVLKTRATNQQQLFVNTRFSGSNSSSHNIVGNKEALKLFVDSPSSHQSNQQGSRNSSRVSKDDSGVDLELRLGSASDQKG